ncbi:resolvase [Bacillus cereus]|nr:resolvase [Bacillus cereus]
MLYSGVWQNDKNKKANNIQYYIQFNEAKLNINRFIEIVEWMLEILEGKDRRNARILIGEGDTIFVADCSRLVRSTKDLLQLVELLESKGVQLVSIKENIDTSTATGRLMLKMISAINDFERENMLERQREGIAIARAEGKYKGRKEVSISDFETYFQRYMNREVSKSQLAKELGISRPTLDKLIKEHQLES